MTGILLLVVARLSILLILLPILLWRSCLLEKIVLHNLIVSFRLLGQTLPDVETRVRVERPLDIQEDAVIGHDTEPLVFVSVQLDEKLRSIHVCLPAIPLDEVTEALRVLQDRANIRQAEPLQAHLTRLGQIQQHVDAVNVEEVQLRPFVAEDGVRKAIEDRQQKGLRITGLLDF